MVNVIIIALSYTINAAESDLHKIKHERNETKNGKKFII